ncbi:MAG TPA: hypothetical protein VFM94_05485 [Solirubrobacterales bacterium]|nr:hypothetical protein [Solirubrobacterales bacterium]
MATGCESTQDKSAKIAAELGPVKQEKGLKISKQSKDVEVVSSALLTDPNGSAVVVRLRSKSNEDLVGVPIAIDVLDAKGKSVYRNDIPGIEPALAAVPFIPAGGETEWVHDQILATGKPAKVEVKVGEGGEPFSGEQPKVSVSDPKIEGDPYSGLLAGGNVENESGEDLERLLLYAVASKGGKIVAAGRGAIEPFKAKPKPIPYNIYFIGDPKGAAVKVSQFPTLPGHELE